MINKAKYNCIFSFQTCSGVSYLNDSSSVFSDGSGSDNYSHNLNCKWVINPPGAIKTNLSFDSLDIGLGDHIYIYEGPDTTYPLLSDLDHNSLADTFLINASHVMLKF